VLARIISLFALPLLLVACDSTPNHSFDGTMKTEMPSAMETQPSTYATSESEDDGLLAQLKADEKAAEQEQAAKEQDNRLREAKFEQNLTLKKSVGTTVCTWQNSVGTVKKIEQDRVQIAVYGRALSATNGIFFSPSEGSPDLTTQEGNVWTDGHDWAVCDAKLR